MKFVLTFKTPDVSDQLESDWMSESELEAAHELIRKFVRYSKYIDVEFDTETSTCCVKELK